VAPMGKGMVCMDLVFEGLGRCGSANRIERPPPVTKEIRFQSFVFFAGNSQRVIRICQSTC
jgi:hypothetical protein